jgi:N-acetylglucosamine-6-sulfatase
MRRSTTHLILLLAILVGIVFPQQATSASTSRPNIIVIQTDDQAGHTLQFMPQTNALLGNQGVRFTNSFVSTSLCCPSRASFLSGLYSHNHNVVANKPPWGGMVSFDDSSTLATWLQDAGYRTGIFGKYLNQYGDVAPYVPPGWDDWRVHVGIGEDGNHGFFNFNLVENGTTVHYGTGSANYSVNVLKRKAVQFIETTPNEEPLFAYFVPFAPHQPATPAPEDEGDFANLPPYRPASYNEADVSDKPAWVRRLPLLTATDQSNIDALYRSQVESLQSVDRAVADIVGALQATGRLENSVIIFTSDNGWMLGAHRWLRKTAVYEDSIRVPLLIRAPGVLPRVEDKLVQNVDLTASIVEWAGATPPYTLDGLSLVELLSNPAQPWRSALLIEFLGGTLQSATNYQAVRTKNFVYAEYINGDQEFYDLVADPDQLTNGVRNSAYASKVAELNERLETFRDEVDLQIRGSAKPSIVPSGGRVTYTYTITNPSATHAGNVIVRYPVPTGMQFVSCAATNSGECVGTPTQGSGRVFFNLLRKGKTATVTVVLQAQAGLTNGTELSGTTRVSGFTIRDLNSGNNEALVRVTIGRALVADTFGRTLSGGWGNADVGGAYTLTGTSSDFSVASGAGRMNLPSPGASRKTHLSSTTALNASAAMRVSANKAAAGDSQRIAILLRRINEKTEYRGEVRLMPGGDVRLVAIAVSSGTAKMIGPSVLVPNLTYLPGTYLRVRAESIGTNPTTIRMCAWVDGTPEPKTWQYSQTDSTASLQVTGAVGLSAALPSTATNAPVQISFDDFEIFGS